MGYSFVRVRPVGNRLWGRCIFIACKVGPVTMETLGIHTVTQPHRTVQKNIDMKCKSLRTEIMIFRAFGKLSAGCQHPLNAPHWPQKSTARAAVCSPSFLPLFPSPALLFLTFCSSSFASSWGLPLHCEQSLLGLFLPLGIESPPCGLHYLLRFANQAAHTF